MSDFSAYLNEILEYSTKTKYALATETGLNRTTFTKYLNGQRSMSKLVLQLLTNLMP